jgi:cell division protein FtsQ
MTTNDRVIGIPRTRSDEVRQRRAKQATVAQQAPRALQPQPKTKRARRPRRRYDVSLPVELGAEMQLPALPRVRVGIRLISGLLAVSVAWCIHFLLTSPQFQVGQLTVSGVQLLTQAQVQSLAKIEPVSIFGLDPALIEERMAGYPEVASTNVVLALPNRVEITLVERSPMVEWDDAGRKWWLSEDGVAMLRMGEWPGAVRVFSSTPVLSFGSDPTQAVISQDVLQAAVSLHRQSAEIGSLIYDPQFGLGFEDDHGWSVFFGVDGDMAMKMMVYQSLAQEIERRGLRVRFVSVEDQTAPYYIVE